MRHRPLAIALLMRHFFQTSPHRTLPVKGSLRRCDLDSEKPESRAASSGFGLNNGIALVSSAEALSLRPCNGAPCAMNPSSFCQNPAQPFLQSPNGACNLGSGYLAWCDKTPNPSPHANLRRLDNGHW